MISGFFVDILEGAGTDILLTNILQTVPGVMELIITELDLWIRVGFRLLSDFLWLASWSSLNNRIIKIR